MARAGQPARAQTCRVQTTQHRHNTKIPQHNTYNTKMPQHYTTGNRKRKRQKAKGKDKRQKAKGKGKGKRQKEKERANGKGKTPNRSHSRNRTYTARTPHTESREAHWNFFIFEKRKHPGVLNLNLLMTNETSGQLHDDQSPSFKSLFLKSHPGVISYLKK